VKCGANDTGTNCETHGYFFYNTNVVFGRNGQVLNLYHKYNLFGEKQFDQPSAPEVVVIETDFGLNFGIFTCFDILFKSPAQDLLARNVDAVIQPSISIILDTSKTDLSEQVCHADQICCDFTAKITTTASSAEKNSYTYHLVAYSGVRSFNGFYNGGIEVCGIIACLNSSLSSCGQRFANYDDIEWPIKFEEITIKASFENDENKTQYPNSLLSSIRPIPVSQTVWEKKEVEGQKSTERTFSLAQPQDRILTFAIYGRNFAQDSPPDGNFGNAIGTSWLM
ncbi:CN hydrolase domain containing protein, partial [Asbolus verrucosus]